MFGFFRRSTPRPLSDAILMAMAKDGQTVGISDLSTLRMVESSGRYSDRKVTYFRVFDPNSTAQRATDVKRFKDFDVFPGLVLRSGHIEQDGTVVLTRTVVVREPDPALRTRAGRTVAMEASATSDSPSGATAQVVSEA